jgi:hypothetical protein
MRLGVDLGGEDRTAPTVFERRLCVPEPGGRILDGQQFDVLAPGQFANDPLENCRIGPRLRERPHVAQIG